jgi:hypothetical protein
MQINFADDGMPSEQAFARINGLYQVDWQRLTGFGSAKKYCN